MNIFENIYENLIKNIMNILTVLSASHAVPTVPTQSSKPSKPSKPSKLTYNPYWLIIENDLEKELNKENQDKVENYLASLPDDITAINISERDMSVMPDLSRFTKLEYLNCSKNKLKHLHPSIQKLPLQTLYCYDNGMTSLFPLKMNENVYLPDSITRFDCNNNCLEDLIKIPQSCLLLICYKNKLKSLPILPNIQTLWCTDNNIEHYPEFPVSLRYWSLDN